MPKETSVENSPAPSSVPPSTLKASSSPAPSSVNPTSPAPKKISTGTKVALGCGIGCLVLLFVVGGLALLLPTVLMKFLPDDLTPEVFEKWLEESSGEDVDIDLEDNKFEFSDDEGDYAYGEDLELPSNFPDDVPLYEDASVISTTITDSDSTVTFQVTGTVVELSEYYKTELTDKGWTVSSEASTSYGNERTDLYTFTKGEVEINMGFYTSDETTVMFYVIYKI